MFCSGGHHRPLRGVRVVGPRARLRHGAAARQAGRDAAPAAHQVAPRRHTQPRDTRAHHAGARQAARPHPRYDLSSTFIKKDNALFGR